MMVRAERLPRTMLIKWAILKQNLKTDFRGTNDITYMVLLTLSKISQYKFMW